MTTQDVLVWLLPPLLLVMGLLTASHALLNKRDSKAAFGWIALCIILPAAGPIMYLLFGINRVRTRAQRDYITKINRDSLQTIAEPDGTSFRPLSLIGETLARKGLSSCSDIQIYENGENLYPAMLDAINNATDRVLLASYIFDNNKTGRDFARALASAQRRGVQVKVLLDGMGEMMSLPRIGGHLSELGIQYTRFNPLKLFPPSLNLNMRNHRKLMIVDGLLAFTGGTNIGDRHLSNSGSNPHRVQDIHFGLRGKIVDELEWAFWQDWYYCTGDPDAEKFRGCNINDESAETWTRLILDSPNRDLDKLSQLINGVIAASKERVYLMTPYFLPTFDLIGTLISARLRGVKITILLPGTNNIKIADWASRNSVRQLLESGLDIRYQPPPFVHSKLLLIDDEYALIGSPNIDPRSLRLNYELGVEVFSRPFNESLRQYFELRAEVSEPITLNWLRERSLLIRLRDSLAWLFSPYL
ncbi:MAG: cardiolipin synthase [Gammaproteobacteria bacterium]|nr:cardiolipin synthase [Gammaproteobacteria bacterium]MBJ53857.1 cardiolipin synthase [Gammaproteobacteria bacterium]HBN15743.1 cardiolipin synthase [Pseudohongiella sp.]